MGVIQVGDKVRIKDVGETEFPKEYNGLTGEVISIYEDVDGWPTHFPYEVEITDPLPESSWLRTLEFNEKELEVINA